MPRNVLTNAVLKSKVAIAIRQAATTGALARIGDGGGLMLVVRPNGEASWLLRYSYGGKRFDLTVGHWPEDDLRRARESAELERAKATSGVNPAAVRRAEREARVAEVRAATVKGHAPGVVAHRDSVRALFEEWLTKSQRSKVYRNNIEKAFLANVLPHIGDQAPHTVERRQVLLIMRKVEERGSNVMLRKLRMWMRQMFDFGIEHEAWPLLLDLPVPTGQLKSFQEPARGRHLPAITNAAEVAPLMSKVLAVTDNYVIRNALLLSAHVWQRPSEIREAVWEEFDLDAARWIIPAERMKMRAEHWVPLSRQVVEMLRRYQGIVGNKGLLFPGRKYGEPISQGTLTSRLITMGYQGKHSPHGFRAMARTIGEEVLKLDGKFLEKQLAHETDTSGLRGAYNRAEYWDERVKMMQKWSDWLDAQTVQP